MKVFVLCLGLIQAKLVCDYGENCEEYCDDDVCEYRNEFCRLDITLGQSGSLSENTVLV